jgi:transcription initiation factor TFIIIB Brf1 subunit/transcription initiation factor TFIIB
MRYCYTEAAKAEITLEMTVADLRELRDAVKIAAAADGSTYRIRRLADDLKAAQQEAADSVRRFAEELQRQVREDAQ